MDAILGRIGRQRLGLLMTFAHAIALTSASAQEQPLGVELRPFVGGCIPTGDHAGVLKAGALLGLQLAFEINRHLSVVGGAAWSSSADKTAAVDRRVDIYHYDVGAEAGVSKPLGGRTVLRPFIGLGGGGRSFGYRGPDPRPQHTFGGYGALGSQLQMGRIGARIEVRDYVTAFKGLHGELRQRAARNDVTIAGGVSVTL
jgi:hypothetical protein